MTLYCRTVEEDNPTGGTLTAELTPAEKRDVIATATACAEEYHAFVAAGKLVPPSKSSALPYLATGPAPPEGASTRRPTQRHQRRALRLAVSNPRREAPSTPPHSLPKTRTT